MALKAGAYHITCVERWLYLSLACKETLEANGVDDDNYNVIYKRPTDLELHKDVKICCNLLLCEIFDEGQSQLLLFAINVIQLVINPSFIY